MTTLRGRRHRRDADQLDRLPAGAARPGDRRAQGDLPPVGPRRQPPRPAGGPAAQRGRQPATEQLPAAPASSCSNGTSASASSALAQRCGSSVPASAPRPPPTRRAAASPTAARRRPRPRRPARAPAPARRRSTRDGARHPPGVRVHRRTRRRTNTASKTASNAGSSDRPPDQRDPRRPVQPGERVRRGGRQRPGEVLDAGQPDRYAVLRAAAPPGRPRRPPGRRPAAWSAQPASAREGRAVQRVDDDRARSSGVFAIAPRVRSTSGRARSAAPSAASADTQSIVSAIPGALSRSSSRTRPTNWVTEEISASFAAGHRAAQDLGRALRRRGSRSSGRGSAGAARRAARGCGWRSAPRPAGGPRRTCRSRGR